MSEAKRDLEKHKFPDLLRVAQQTEKHVESVNRGATPDLARRAQ
jgi:hypothetical protein